MMVRIRISLGVVCLFAVAVLFSACEGRDINQLPMLQSQSQNPSTGPFIWNGSSCYDTVMNQNVNSAYCQQNYFSWQGSECWDNLSQQMVHKLYCQNGSASNRYNWQGDRCYDNHAQTLVDDSFCETTSDQSPEQCVGVYYDMASGSPQRVRCHGSDCSGQTLYDSHGQKVHCL